MKRPTATSYPSDVAFTPGVKAIQTRKGSRQGYASMEPELIKKLKLSSLREDAVVRQCLALDLPDTLASDGTVADLFKYRGTQGRLRSA